MYPYVKRLLDLLLAAALLILLLPFYLLIALAIRLDSPGPVFFSQLRVGRNKLYFKLYKFRSMRIDTPRDVPSHMLKTPSRWITRVGRLLRKTSLDELPQLYNILIGDMSFVGPRPALWNQGDLVLLRDKYPGKNGLTPNQLRPGLTGWAQVNGRDRLDIPVKAAYDGEYARRISFLFDCRCMLLTVVRVFQAEGVKEGDGEGDA